MLDHLHLVLERMKTLYYSLTDLSTSARPERHDHPLRWRQQPWWRELDWPRHLLLGWRHQLRKEPVPLISTTVSVELATVTARIQESRVVHWLHPFEQMPSAETDNNVETVLNEGC